MRCDVIAKQRGQQAEHTHCFLDVQERECHFLSGEDFSSYFTNEGLNHITKSVLAH